MPNHVTNILRVVAENKEEIFNTIKGQNDDQFIDFNKILPMPEELKGTTSPTRILSEEEYAEQKPNEFAKGITQEMSDQLMKKYGASNWYDWANRNWHTKWNAYDQLIDENGNIIFLTAWSTPMKLIQELSHLYPLAYFTVEFADEDAGYNCGSYTFQAGDLVECYEPEFGTKEAIEYANNILGYDCEEIEQ
jgi:hypothetical protein